MTYSSHEGRDRIFRDSADAAAGLLGAIEALGTAYEALDEHAADELERHLYAPIGLAAKTLLAAVTAFAARSDETFERPVAKHFPGGREDGARQHVDAAIAFVGESDEILAELQDSLIPVEVGDAALREGLSATRRTLAPLPQAARELERTLGR
jgi:hypothetical protein